MRSITTVVSERLSLVTIGQVGDADGIGTPSEQIARHVGLTDPDGLAAWGDARALVEWFLLVSLMQFR